MQSRVEPSGGDQVVVAAGLEDAALVDHQDLVGLVEYSDRARVLLEPTRNKREVERALRYLVPNGSTNAEDGLVLGYDLAGQFFRRDGINRVILATDGDFNVGVSSEGDLVRLIEKLNADGTTIVVITHDREIAARFPRQVSLLDGRVVEDTSSTENHGST